MTGLALRGSWFSYCLEDDQNGCGADGDRDDIVPSKEPSVIEQPLMPAVMTPAVDQANRVG
jgi:hypothetical protein